MKLNINLKGEKIKQKQKQKVKSTVQSVQHISKHTSKRQKHSTENIAYATATVLNTMMRNIHVQISPLKSWGSPFFHHIEGVCRGDP